MFPELPRIELQLFSGHLAFEASKIGPKKRPLLLTYYYVKRVLRTRKWGWRQRVLGEGTNFAPDRNKHKFPIILMLAHVQISVKTGNPVDWPKKQNTLTGGSAFELLFFYLTYCWPTGIYSNLIWHFYLFVIERKLRLFRLRGEVVKKNVDATLNL